MSEPFKIGYDAACPKCRALDATCPEHRERLPDEVFIGSLLGFYVQFAEPNEDERLPGELTHADADMRDWLRSFTMEVTMQDVDPDVLGILTGGVMGNPPPPTFPMNVSFPARRRAFWEWLRRKPKHSAGIYYLPNVSIQPIEEGENDEH